jgi:hypothetical protein
MKASTRFAHLQHNSTNTGGFQRESAILRGKSSNYIAITKKNLRPNLSGYGDIYARKIWSFCGSTTVPVERDALFVNCACPSLTR